MSFVHDVSEEQYKGSILFKYIFFLKLYIQAKNH